ncbi:hypothetical protein Hanom_Chr11g01035051 [Helianthus anomalus]
MGDECSNTGSDLSIFVGDLAAIVTDILLNMKLFQIKYPYVVAKFIIDASTCQCFVRFGDDSEWAKAMTEMIIVHIGPCVLNARNSDAASWLPGVPRSISIFRS